MVKNLPTDAGNTGSIPGQGTKIPHAAGQLTLRAISTEPAREPVLHNKRSPRTHRNWESSPSSLHLEIACAQQQRPSAAKK